MPLIIKLYKSDKCSSCNVHVYRLNNVDWVIVDMLFHRYLPNEPAMLEVGYFDRICSYIIRI